MHALIIEDEPVIAMMIEEILRENGYTSFGFAVSAAEAVEVARAHCPDLITSDVALKPGNGIDAIVEICGTKALPVIFVTSNDAEVRRRLPRHLVVRKPFLAADLNAAIRSFSD
ncbi:response regulator [Sphingomonas sp. LY54]|uniref:response regulator n=1 Tax=Sphingomonadales TaxID=204457 RepID=UPI002ADEF800|nr:MULTISPECIES: response regulator [Sphingomonadales]MEA1015610.1 response regulator [Sphingosinicella sp. LY1275]WRP29501.1 response regulator [Sphingomonas sp. LY54]